MINFLKEVAIYLLMASPAILVISLIAFFNIRQRKNQLTATKIKKVYCSLEDAKIFVDELEKLGYFKYSNPNDVEVQKQKIIETYMNHGTLDYLLDEDTFLPQNHRIFSQDSKYLWRKNGVINFLQELAPSFDKMNFQFTIQKNDEYLDQNTGLPNQKLTINNTVYLVYENFDGFGEMFAPQKVAEILNDELLKQNKEERVFLINEDEGALIFLSDKLYPFLKRKFQNIKTTKEWEALY